MVQSKLDSMTLSMNLYGKLPQGVDYSTIPGTRIHRADLKYDFNRDTGQGMGLLLNEKEDESCFL